MLSRRLALAALIAITLLSCGLRVWQARESLWLDELHTAWCATGSLVEVAPRAAIGNQSPLFFWLEWLLVQALGPSELALRLPSLIAGTLLGVALFDVCRRWTGQPWLGVLAAWLVAVDPRQIFYGTEARPYALVELLAVVHVALLARMIERPTPLTRALWILGAVLLFHLHYTAVLLLPAEIAYLLLAGPVVHSLTGVRSLRERKGLGDAPAQQKDPLAEREDYSFRSLALDLFFVAAFCLPAFGQLQAIFARRANWEAFVPQQSATAILSLWPLTLSAVLVLANPDWFLRRTSDDRRQPMPLAILLWAIVPVALAWLATATETARLLFPRYVIVSAPAATLLGVMCLRLAPWRSLQFILGLGIALYAIRSSGIVEQLRTAGRPIADRADDWRSAIAWFNAQPGHTQHPVLVRSWLIEAAGLRQPHARELEDYCLYPVTSLYRIDADRQRLIPLPRSQAGKLQLDVRDQIHAAGGAWLVLGGRDESASAIERELLASIESSEAVQGPRSKVQGRLHWTIHARRSFGNIRVVHLRRASLNRQP